jgi:3-phenylpropionate/trans-cinnamate dioxygenase ferredoxin subunit
VSRFIRVGRTDEVRPGEKKVAEVDGVLIVIVNLDGQYYALEDVCTHDGGPLGEGRLVDGQLICPRHGAHFDVRTGAALTLPAFDPVPTYAVHEQGGELFVEVY